MAITGADRPGPRDPVRLGEVQRIVRSTRERHDLLVTAQVALLDACAELGELAGAYLKQSGYAPCAASADGGAAPPAQQVRAEFGDTLFALFSFADAAGVSAEAEFAATLARYEERFADRVRTPGRD